MRALAALAILIGFAGCAPDLPVFVLGPRACDARPVLDGALAVPLGPGGAAVQLGPDSRCLPGPNGGVTYAVFRLPEEPTTVTVVSVAGVHTLVPPRVTVTDDTGLVRRVLALGDFQSGLRGLRAGLRTQPGDRYLIVAADPAMVGQPILLRMGERDAHRAQVASRIIFVPVGPADRPEQPTEAEVTFSLNGTIRVAAAAIRLAD